MYALGLAALLLLQPSLTTTLRDVDGVRIRVRTSGLSERKPGQPVVVFESGGASPLETWDSILTAVASFAPVIASDRSGTGQSEWDKLSPTPERIAARLRQLLAVLGVAPPYVFVGHSWGGALVRYYIGRHPEGVVGVLYLDPTDITQTTADEIAVFEAFGAGAAEHAAFDRMMETVMAAAPPALRAESAVVMSLLRSPLESRRLGEPPPVRTSIIISGRPAVMPPKLPFDVKAYAAAAHAARMRRMKSWAAHGGIFEAPLSSSHMVHIDVADMVVAEIRRLAGR
jgi:pimeloyl-ACP methyl ester carboxylesterase